MDADLGPHGGRDRVAGRDPVRPTRRRLGFAVVRGRSMLPTLAEGDRLLVRYLPGPRTSRALRPGRLVVCLPPGRPVAVKRLGRRGEAGWWVESDNDAEGTDSRTFGPLPDDSMLAVVVCRMWPNPSWLRQDRSARQGPPG